MPLPKLTDLTPEQKERYGEAHETFLRSDAFDRAITLLENDHIEHDRREWEKYVIPVLQAEFEKADAEHWRIMRELGYEAK